MLCRHYQSTFFDVVERDLARAAFGRIAVVKIGDCGPDRRDNMFTIETVDVDNDNWYQAFLKLSAYALGIFIVPGVSCSLQSEIIHLLADEGARAKLFLLCLERSFLLGL